MSLIEIYRNLDFGFNECEKCKTMLGSVKILLTSLEKEFECLYFDPILLLLPVNSGALSQTYNYMCAVQCSLYPVTFRRRTKRIDRVLIQDFYSYALAYSLHYPGNRKMQMIKSVLILMHLQVTKIKLSLIYCIPFYVFIYKLV